MAAIKRPIILFPEEDLLQSLIDLYFLHTPASRSILHQPTFRKNVACGLHHIDTSFAAVVLDVCAIGSRVSNDPRVFIDGTQEHSAGWRYFVQTAETKRSLLSCPSLFDVQACCVSDYWFTVAPRSPTLFKLGADYLLGTSAPQACWTVVGLGMRYAVELGYHRRRPGPPNEETEQQKRVFWCLYKLDRHLSLYYGRPFCIRDEEYV